MRYKNNVLNKLDQIDSTLLKIQFDVNRGVGQDATLIHVDELKEQLEVVRGMIGVEPDDLENQF
jgi:hypothetical protein